MHPSSLSSSAILDMILAIIVVHTLAVKSGVVDRILVTDIIVVASTDVFDCHVVWLQERGAREASDAIDHSLHEQPSGISSSVVDGSLVAPSMECFGIPTVDSDTDIVSDVSSSDFSDLACHSEVDVADN